MDESRKHWGRGMPVFRRPLAGGVRALFERLEPRTFLSTVTWDGGPTGLGTDWHDAANWVDDTLPVAGDDVVIASGGHIDFSSGSLVLNSLVSSVPMAILGGSLSVTGSASVTAPFELNGGALGGSWTLPSLLVAANPANALAAATINGDITLAADNAFISVTGSLTVNGLIAMQGDGAAISFSGSVQTFAGNVDVEFSGFTGLRSISVDDGGLLTLAPTTTFLGERGRITSGLFAGSGTVLNSGMIWANIDQGTIQVDPSVFTNLGTLRTTSGGILKIAAADWTNNGTISINNGTLGLGGTFEVAAGIGIFNRTGGTVTIDGTIMNAGGTLTLNAATGSWQFNGGQIVGGVVALTGAATLDPSALGSGRIAAATVNGNLSWLVSNFTVELDAVTLNGSITFSGLSTLSIKNGITLNGALTLSGDDTEVQWIGGAQTLLGNASVFLRHSNCYFWAITPLTIPATATITGYGHIFGSITSAAAMASDTSGKTLIVAKGNFQNSGPITVSAGARLFVGDVNPGSTTFSNSGSIIATGSATIALGPTLNSGPIAFSNSGSLKIESGTSMTVGAQLVFNQITVSNSGTIESAAGSTLTIGTSVALLPPVLDNTGVIKATESGLIVIQTPATTAQLGDLRAAGGTVRLQSTLDNTGGTLNQDAISGSWEINGGRINGGTINNQGGGAALNFTSSTSNVLDAVTITGKGAVSGSGARVQIVNGLTLNGTLTLSGANAAISFNGGAQSLSGTGGIVLADPAGASVSVDAGGVLTIGASITISGAAGQLRAGYVFGGNGSIINAGTISGGLTINPSSFTNMGTVEAPAGATLHVLSSVANYSSGTLTGGTWRILSGATLDFAPGPITSNNSTIILDGAKATFAAAAALAENSGTIRLLNGRGLTVPGDFVNAGTLDLSSTSIFRSGGKFTQSAQGLLGLHITPSSSSFVYAATMAALNGTVDFTWVGFIPPVGTRVNFMKTPVISGTFATLTSTPLGPARVQTLSYTASNATLVVSAPPNSEVYA